MRFLTFVCLALALTACGSEQRSEREPTVGKEIADDYNRQMDKARAVEQQALEQKRKVDEALKAAEGQ